MIDITRMVGRTGLLLKKYSPELLTTVGIAGMVGTVVLASRATLKVQPLIEEFHEEKIEIDYDYKNGLYISDKEKNKDLSRVYIKTATEVSKIYAPAATLGISSIACIIAAHGIMNKRAAALTAAYKVLESTFAEYRNRVIEHIGEEKERNLRTNKKEVEHSTPDGTKHQAITMDTNAHSPYARFFDEHSVNWSKTPEYNLLFLKAQQNYANDLLHSRGHVFLNEVYDMLGIPRSQAGQVVGWVISKTGDNFVDFGMYDHHNNNAHLFVNGYEGSILLDFNVDGVIYDLI